MTRTASKTFVQNIWCDFLALDKMVEVADSHRFFCVVQGLRCAPLACTGGRAAEGGRSKQKSQGVMKHVLARVLKSKDLG